MGIDYVEDAPREIRQFGDEESAWGGMTVADVQHVAEIFNTPLTGSYNWDYRVADDRIQRLYELGKTLNWNGSLDVHWDQTPDWHEQTPVKPEFIDEFLANADWNGYPPFDAFSTERKLAFFKHDNAWSLSQFLHGEQGALLVASQLASCAPSFNAKLYAASQTFDEARHVEVFNRYLQTKVGLSYPVNQGLKSLLDKILTDERWDL